MGECVSVVGMSNDYLNHLATVPLFRACNKKELALVARSIDELEVEAGRVLTEKGAAAHEAFIIVAGEAIVDIDGTEVARISNGDHFGELALLDGGPRTATVTAATDLTMLVIDQRSFFGLLDDVPGLSRKIMSSLAAIIREQNESLAKAY